MLWSTSPAGGVSAWHVQALENLVRLVVACPATTLCVLGDANGNVLTSTSPAGGAWTTTHVARAASIDHLVCPSTTDCVAIDSLSQPIETTDPTGPAGAWTTGSTIDGVLYGLSCASATLCVATDGGGSALVGTPPAPPRAGGPPTISGTPQVGKLLFEGHAPWSGHPTSYAYQWERCDAAGAGCADIPGATLSVHTVTADDAGHALRVRETAANAAGPGSPVESAATAVVPAVAPSAGGGGATGGGSPPPAPGAGVSPAQIRAALLAALVPASRAARIRALLQAGGASVSFGAPAAGVVTLAWSATPRAHAKRIVVASARLAAGAAGARRLKLKLTAAGRRLLARAKRLTVTGKATFAPAQGAPVSAARTITLER